jgi:hypothetical protein
MATVVYNAKKMELRHRDYDTLTVKKLHESERIWAAMASEQPAARITGTMTTRTKG